MLKKRFTTIATSLAATLALTLAIGVNETEAKAPDVYGGIMNEYEYEEVVFLSGEPILFRGTIKNVKINETVRSGTRTETHSLKLVRADGQSPDDELTRTFSYVYDIQSNTAIGQNTENGTIRSMKEEVMLNGITYVLEDYQFSNGILRDLRPANTYYSGNGIVRKIYETDEDVPKRVVVELTSRNDGYENFWGATETKFTDAVYLHDELGTFTVQSRVSNSKTKTLTYEESLPSLASFEGGYVVVTSSDVLSEYTYDIPEKKLSGQVELTTSYSDRIERLVVPKFRDLATHWAKPDIEKLYSLGVYKDESNFFSPGTPMQRYDFAVAVAKAIDLRVELEQKNKKNTVAKSLFSDVKVPTRAVEKEDYAYFASIVEKDVIRGENGMFKPNNSLTRQQAASIIVRALGLEHRAPDPGYQTSYLDDARISDYARDGVYIMQELSIMMGDPTTNMFNPHKPLTRAQASAIIIRFLQYLEEDLKVNYRDDVLLFNQ